MTTLHAPSRRGLRALAWIAAIAAINLVLMGLTLAPVPEQAAEAFLSVSPVSPPFGARFDPRPPASASQPRGPLAQNPPPSAPSAMCQTNGTIWDIAARGDTLYLAGIFTQVRPAGTPLGDPASQDRNGLAACDANTGAILAFDPNPTATLAANLSIESLAFSPDGAALYFGGRFDGVGGEPRRNAAAVDAVTGAPLAWDPRPTSKVYDIAVSGDGATAYIAGSFGLVAHQAAGPGAQISGFAPQIKTMSDTVASVRALALSADGATLYFGGGGGRSNPITSTPAITSGFALVNGAWRAGAAAIDTVTGTTTRAFAPRIEDQKDTDLVAQIYDIVVRDSVVYLCGDWWLTNGGAALGGWGEPDPNGRQSNLGRFNAVSGAWDASWKPWTDGGAQGCDLDAANSALVVGGHFVKHGGPAQLTSTVPSQKGLAVFDLITAEPVTWSAALSGGTNPEAFAVRVRDNQYVVGGAFPGVNAVAQQNLAAFTLRPAVMTYVIQISVDGLGSAYVQSLLAANQIPSLARLLNEGAGTLNARTDFDFSITLPNHTAMLTGRPVYDKFGDNTTGHQWTGNGDPLPGQTLHTNRGFYVASVFDAAHDNGLTTGAYASKSKFSLYDTSYNSANGAPDTNGANNGPDKIDTNVVAAGNSPAMMSALLDSLRANPTQYTFVHFHDPDSAGHASGWGSANYSAAVIAVDGHLGQLLAAIEQSPALAGRTTVILTADHGGSGTGHSDASQPIHYTIPFVVWGPGIPHVDLYALNGFATTDPGGTRPDFALTGMPIRNGDAGNCALRRLGLPQIPGSRIANLNNPCSPVVAPVAPPSTTSPLTQTVTLILPNGAWRYRDDGIDQGTAWRGAAFDDFGWSSGSAELGYGDGDEATAVGFGANPNGKFITTWFRRAFTITNPASVMSLTLELVRDDGAVVYLNDAEVFRSNMPAGVITHTTLAGGNTGVESAWHVTSVSPSLLVNGPNVLAVEIHQGLPTSSDISFNASLSAILPLRRAFVPVMIR
ncbi:MAG TPA: alkaline phosphatase family protein [Thermoflexales bacterium]|nr:alkaline phosphatase family protein [Thermoflexales bacterium]